MEDKLAKAKDIEAKYNVEMDDIMLLSDEEYIKGYDPEEEKAPIYGNYEYFERLELSKTSELYDYYKKIDSIEIYVNEIFNYIENMDYEESYLTDNQLAIFDIIATKLQYYINYLEKDIKSEEEREKSEKLYYVKSEILEDIFEERLLLNKIENILKKIKQSRILIGQSIKLGGR